MRRSSEISNNSGLVSPSPTNATGDLSPVNGTNTSELNINVDSEGHPSGPASPDSSSISPSAPLSVNVPVNSATTSPIQRPSSRSSTPSPPPPPPPIQLHYPYPGIQSHLHHGQPRSTGINSPFTPNTTRPASISMTHGMTTKSRPALSSHGSHPANSSYQAPFVSMSPQTQTSRMSFTSPARAGAP
ncbi:unnamed protein product, partial [Echinostoma caproni]|uniref:PAM2 domain-containing protein n=1 Tax=Echinostoma caproni TaxID=27848 RepID=A0A183BBU6_9TREM